MGLLRVVNLDGDGRAERPRWTSPAQKQAELADDRAEVMDLPIGEQEERAWLRGAVVAAAPEDASRLATLQRDFGTQGGGPCGVRLVRRNAHGLPRRAVRRRGCTSPPGIVPQPRAPAPEGGARRWRARRATKATDDDASCSQGTAWGNSWPTSKDSGGAGGGRFLSFVDLARCDACARIDEDALGARPQASLLGHVVRCDANAERRRRKQLARPHWLRMAEPRLRSASVPATAVDGM